MASLPTLDKNANSYINFIWVFLGVAETIVGSLLCSLHSKRFQSSYCTKVRRRAKKGGRGRGDGRRGNLVSFVPLPLPRHSFLLLSSQLSRQTGAETLATQASFCVVVWVLLSVFSFFCMTSFSDWHPPATPKTYFFCTYWLSFINTKRFNVSLTIEFAYFLTILSKFFLMKSQVSRRP